LGEEKKRGWHGSTTRGAITERSPKDQWHKGLLQHFGGGEKEGGVPAAKKHRGVKQEFTIGSGLGSKRQHGLTYKTGIRVQNTTPAEAKTAYVQKKPIKIRGRLQGGLNTKEKRGRKTGSSCWKNRREDETTQREEPRRNESITMRRVPLGAAVFTGHQAKTWTEGEGKGTGQIIQSPEESKSIRKKEIWRGGSTGGCPHDTQSNKSEVKKDGGGGGSTAIRSGRPQTCGLNQ